MFRLVLVHVVAVLCVEGLVVSKNRRRPAVVCRATDRDRTITSKLKARKPVTSKPSNSAPEDLVQVREVFQAAQRKRLRLRPKALGAAFWDEARIEVTGGTGGNGCLSFRREKYVPLGGPSGGNGGNGGSIIFICDEELNTLSTVRRRTQFVGFSGSNGQGKFRHAVNRADTYVRVPPGTIVREDDDSSSLSRELVEHGETVVVARGGRGGRGNAAFKTERLTAPRIAEKGEPGSSRMLRLELKLVADVGLVGKPNAGKSTLLAAATSARPKIAAYAFTTIVPNLGVWEPAAYSRARKRDESDPYYDAVTKPSAESALSLATRARRGSVGGETKANRIKRERRSLKRTNSRGTRKEARFNVARAAREQVDPSMDFWEAPAGEDDDAQPVKRRRTTTNYADQTLSAALGLKEEEQSEEEDEGEMYDRMERERLARADRSTAGESRGLVLCDVPGLIEDAHEGAGMGDAFLRHVARCSILVHVVDASAEDPVADMKTIVREIEQYADGALASKPRLVVLNKMDAILDDDSRVKDLELAARDFSSDGTVLRCSAAAGQGVTELMTQLRALLDVTPVEDTVVKKKSSATPRAQFLELDPPFANSRTANHGWTLLKGADVGFDGQWRIESPRVEKIAQMTNFELEDAVARFGRQLEALGISEALRDQGAQVGDVVMIGDDVDLEYDPYGYAPFAELARSADIERGMAEEMMGDDMWEGEDDENDRRFFGGAQSREALDLFEDGALEYTLDDDDDDDDDEEETSAQGELTILD